MINETLKRWELNQLKMEEEDKVAKSQEQLVNRYIRERFADGYAYYKIIRENKRTVRIQVITDIGDDWSIPYWGNEATIDKQYAIENFEERDAIDQLFSKA